MPESRPGRIFGAVSPAAVTLLLLTASSEGALAAAAPDRETWRTECGSCHVAYPAGALGPKDWSRVLSALDRHYGVDASLGSDDLAAVARYLRAQPGAWPSGGGGSLPRITTSEWFREEHDEVPAGTWQRRGVMSAANCSACHPRAEQGVFDEDSIRIPK